MKTYYLQFSVVPSDANEHCETIEGALACCWILENHPDNAYRKARFYVEKGDWEVRSIESHPTETTREDFADRDIGVQHYDKAQVKGIAVAFVGWSKDGKTGGQIELHSSYKSDLAKYLKEVKRNRTSGRCLHYEAGDRCNEFVNAHSIQNKGLLSRIAKDGHVYGLSHDIGSLKKKQGEMFL